MFLCKILNLNTNMGKYKLELNKSSAPKTQANCKKQKNGVDIGKQF